MQSVDLIPTPDTIPVAWGWFQFFLTFTFVLHLVFMNLMLGGTFIALVNSLRARPQAVELARDLSHKLPFSVAFAVNAGVAPLLFLQVLYGHFVYSSSVLMAAPWLSIIGLLILAYYAMYLFHFKYDSWGNARNLLVGGALLIMLFIGFMFTNNWTLALSPDKWAAYFASPGGTLLNLDEPTLWPRYLHMVLGAVAVAGLGMAVVGWNRNRNNQDGILFLSQGLDWFKWSTLIQVGIGTWWLVALPKATMKLFMGGHMIATAAFGIGFLLALVSLVFAFMKKLWPTLIATFVTLVAMAVMREFVRYGSLHEHFTPSQLKVVSDPSSLILFLVTLVAGVGCIFYMLKLTANAGKEA